MFDVGRRREVNIKTDLKEVRWKGVGWTDLSQDRGQWRTTMNTLLNIRVPQNAGNLLTNGGTVSF